MLSTSDQPLDTKAALTRQSGFHFIPTMDTSLHYLLHSGKNPKWLYYLRAVSSDLLPDSWFRARLHREMEHGRRAYDEAYVEACASASSPSRPRTW